MSLLEVRGMRKTYGERLLFEAPHLALECGKNYLLTGSNGVGKTTLLRILAGLEPAEMARYVFAGQAIAPSAIAGLAPAIVYMHQHPYLFHSSVAANIGYGLKALGWSRKQIQQQVEEEMAWADLHDVAGVPPAKLSGGERQRVALARARALKPRLLLLDEPTASLDASARHQVVDLIASMSDGNNCVLVATHDRELIERPWSGGRYVLENLELKSF